MITIYEDLLWAVTVLLPRRPRTVDALYVQTLKKKKVKRGSFIHLNVFQGMEPSDMLLPILNDKRAVEEAVNDIIIGLSTIDETKTVCSFDVEFVQERNEAQTSPRMRSGG